MGGEEFDMRLGCSAGFGDGLEGARTFGFDVFLSVFEFFVEALEDGKDVGFEGGCGVGVGGSESGRVGAEVFEEGGEAANGLI